MRCLVVDDEPLAHKIISNYCDNLSFLEIVKKCHSAFEAINYLNENEVDLIFLDINMPIMNGWDFLDQVNFLPHSVRDSMKIVMLSASTNPDDIARSEQYPFVKDYACKPINASRVKIIFENLEI